MGLALYLFWSYFCSGFILKFIALLLITTTNRNIWWLNLAPILICKTPQQLEKIFKITSGLVNVWETNFKITEFVQFFFFSFLSICAIEQRFAVLILSIFSLTFMYGKKTIMETAYLCIRKPLYRITFYSFLFILFRF